MDPKEPTAQPHSPIRAIERHKVVYPILVIATQKGTTTIATGRTTDLSEGGMAVSLSSAFLLGQLVTVEIPVPSEEHPVKVRAVVRYGNDDRHGFQFDGITEEQKSRIRRLTKIGSASGEGWAN